jgi:hypothetical protein
MGKQGFTLKRVIVILLVILSISGSLVIAFAIKSPTNTRSEATTDCTEKPKMVLDSTDKYATMNIYHLKIINNCTKQNEFIVNVKSFPDSPEKYKNWSWKFKNGEWNSEFRTEPLSGTSDISLTIRIPMDPTGLPEKIQAGIYRFFVVETALAGNPSLSDNLELIYSVD